MFKKHITQNILIAFGALLFAELALERARPAVRLAWAALSAAAAFNVLFLVQGRTGYLVLAALIVLFLFRTLRWKGIVPAALLLAAAGAAGYQFSDSFHQRVSLALAAADQWRPGVASQDPVGERLEFYSNTLAIVRGPSRARRGHGRLRTGLRAARAGYGDAAHPQPAQSVSADDFAGRAGGAGAASAAVLFSSGVARTGLPAEQ